MNAPRLTHVASNVVPASGSAYTMVPRLCDLLTCAGFDIELVSADETEVSKDGVLRNGFPIHGFRKSWLGAAIGRSASLEAELKRLSCSSDLFHIHGLWRLSGIVALVMARRNGVPAIVSPMGLLAPKALEISGLRKRAYWHLLQRHGLDGLACFHATSTAEHDHLRHFGIRAPIAVIPLGVDLPIQTPPPGLRQKPRTVLCLGRISPIKNQQALVHAWRSVQNLFPEAYLRIVGPDDRGHSAKIARTAQEVGAKRLSIEPGAWGAARRDAFRASDLAIMPSLSESFGLVVAEAMAMSLPVIATTGSPWRVLAEAQCGWWVDPVPCAIAQAVEEALNLPQERLMEMGTRGRLLAEREFSWSKSIPRFVQLYDWILGGGNPPGFVSL